jgi:hypothetical protein
MSGRPGISVTILLGSESIDNVLVLRSIWLVLLSMQPPSHVVDVCPRFLEMTSSHISESQTHNSNSLKDSEISTMFEFPQLWWQSDR